MNYDNNKIHNMFGRIDGRTYHQKVNLFHRNINDNNKTTIWLSPVHVVAHN